MELKMRPEWVGVLFSNGDGSQWIIRRPVPVRTWCWYYGRMLQKCEVQCVPMMADVAELS